MISAPDPYPAAFMVLATSARMTASVTSTGQAIQPG